MLWNLSSLLYYHIRAADGEIGAVSDVLFDDSSWKLRWLVVDTGNWLPGRKVLLPLNALQQPDADARILPVNLTMKQVRDSPDIDTDMAVTRRHEAHVFDFYGLDPYWGGNLVPVSNAMALPFIAPLAPDQQREPDLPFPAPGEEGDPHLRSAEATNGYKIHASDGEIGHVADFLIETEDWGIRFLKVDTGNWWPGQLVLIQPQLVQDIAWAERLISINVTRQAVKDSPPYQAGMTVDGAYEEKLAAYYNYGGGLGIV